jgi:site-specific recombinase XerD
MPYGFATHLVEKGYKTETIESYLKVTGQFFSFINLVYPNGKEPYEISPSDIKNYLENQEKRKKSISTINKELTILKNLFNYLWEVDKVPVDPAVKIKRYRAEDKPSISITFKEITELLDKVLNNSSYSSYRKAVFILAVKGLRTSEYRFKKSDVKIEASQDYVEICLPNRVMILKGMEANYFIEYYYEAQFLETDYVFTTKRAETNDLVPIEVMGVLNQLRMISNDYLPSQTESLTLINIRKALAYELYVKQRLSIQMIAKELGIEEKSASSYIKKLIEGTTEANIS